MEWSMVHDPFDGTIPQLRSLASSPAEREGDGINCDETEDEYILPYFRHDCSSRFLVQRFLLADGGEIGTGQINTEKSNKYR